MISRLLDKHPDDEEVQGQLNEILEAISLESRSSEPSWSEVFSNSTKSRNLHRVFLGMGPYMMNQWSGINVSRFVIEGSDKILTHTLRRCATTSLSFSRSTWDIRRPFLSSWPPSHSPNTPSSLALPTFTLIASAAGRV